MVDILDVDEKLMKQSKADRERVDAENEEWGVHPVGALVGAASGAGAATLAGAALGGPAGAVAGAIFGAVAGGLAGDEVAEAVNPKTIEGYWEKHYPMRPYAKAENGYDYYKDGYVLSHDQINYLIAGNIVAFIVALLAIKSFIGFLTKNGFKVFGYYRIIVGIILLLIHFFIHPLTVI